MSIVLMLNFKRSGGTIVNQCIGSLPDIVMLSEVSPEEYSCDTSEDLRSVREQARRWYGIDIDSDDFVKEIIELDKQCQEKGKTLVIRDWTYNSFRPPDSLAGRGPSNRLMTYELLNEQNLDLRVFALVRDAIDVWLSSGKPKVRPFFGIYLKYVHALLGVENLRIFKFEDFCNAPDEFMRSLCEFTGFTFSISYKSYRFFDKVFGDVQVKGGSRGKIQGKIRPLPRKRIPKRLEVELNSCKDMILANQLLDYPTVYEAVSRELWIQEMMVRSKRACNIMIEKIRK